MWKVGFSVIKIRQRLSEEGIQVSRKSLYYLLKKHNETSSVADLTRTPRRRLLTDEHFRFIDETMEANLELTSRQLHGMVAEKFSDASVSTSTSTVKRTRYISRQDIVH